MRERLTGRLKCRQTIARRAAPPSVKSIWKTCGKARRRSPFLSWRPLEAARLPAPARRTSTCRGLTISSAGSVSAPTWTPDENESDARLPASNFFNSRRHVSSGPENHARRGPAKRQGGFFNLKARLRREGGKEFRQPEIQNFDEAVGPQHDVFRLDVAVNDARGVRHLKGAGGLNGHVERIERR